jgi:hypothetical protein
MNSKRFLVLPRGIWCALTGCQLAFLYLAHAISDHATPLQRVIAASQQKMILPLFAVVAGIALASSRYLPNWLARRSLRSRHGGGLWAGQEGVGDALEAERLAIGELAPLYTVPLVIRMVLYEGVALLGLMASFSLLDPRAIYPFLFFSLLGSALSYPTETRLRQIFS